MWDEHFEVVDGEVVFVEYGFDEFLELDDGEFVDLASVHLEVVEPDFVPVGVIGNVCFFSGYVKVVPMAAVCADDLV